MNPRFEISNLQSLWWWIRQVSGDAAYENYLRSHHKRRKGCSHGRGEPLSREEFFLDALRRKYTGVSRCC